MMSISRKLILGSAIVLGILLAGAVTLYTLFDAARLKEQFIQRVGQQTGRQLTIAGDLKLSIWPQIGLRTGALSLSEVDGKSELLKLDSANVSVAVLPLLSGKIEAKHIELDGLTLRLVKYRDGRLNVDDWLGKDASKGDSPSPPLAAESPAASSYEISLAGIDIRDLRLTYLDERSGKTTEIRDLDLSTAEVVSNTKERTLTVEKFKLAIHLVKDDLKLLLELVSPKLAMTSGILKADFAASLDLAGQTIPAGRLRMPANIQLTADVLQRTAKGAVAAQLEESTIDLRLELAQISPLGLGFDVRINSLNLDRYLTDSQPADSTAISKPVNPEQQKAGDKKIDFSWLKALNAKGKIALDRLQFKNLKFEQVSAQLKLENGRLQLAPINARLYEGRSEGELSIEAEGNGIALRERILGVSMTPLLHDLNGKDFIEGRGNISLDLETHGSTAAGFKRQLDGKASVVLRDGAIKGLDVGKILREVQATMGKGNVSGAMHDSDKTEFSEFSASFDIQNGVARNRDLAIVSPIAVIGGEGQIDLVNESLDYMAKLKLSKTLATEEAKKGTSLLGLSVPVRIYGPFAKPVYALQLDQLVAEGVKLKLEENQGRLKEKAVEALGRELQKLLQH